MDSKEKLKYQKSKYTVKKWESEFKKMTNAIPTKADIKCAPSKIKDAYKTYWSLKNCSQRNKLCDISVDENAKDCFNSSSENVDESKVSKNSSPRECKLSEDSMCFQPLSETLSDSRFNESFTNGSPAVLTEESLRSTIDSVLSAKNGSGGSEKSMELLTSFKNLFGKVEDYGIKTTEKENRQRLEAESLSCKYAEKLFAGSKFNKRNPRKPRKMSRSESATCVTDKKPDADKPTLSFVNKAFSFGNDSKEKPLCNEGSLPEDPSPSDSSLLLPDKFKIVNRNVSSQSQAVSLLQRNYDSTNSKLFSGNIDKGWLDRIDKVSEKKMDSPPFTESQDSGISSMKSDSYTNPGLEAITVPKDDDDDNSSDLIYDSDCESQSQSFCRLNLLDNLNYSASDSCRKPLFEGSFIVAKKTSDKKSTFTSSSPLTSSIDKLSENDQKKSTDPNDFGVNKDNFQCNNKKRYFSSPGTSEPESKKFKEDKTNIYSFVSTTKPELITNYTEFKKKNGESNVHETDKDEKKNRKMELLEKKMASGSANENFVRINIEKKRYVRGKKQMNYSKYKKQKWKDAKKSRGFDASGGVLKCFKCGDVGHFSKTCPNKKDGLLPLEDYDSSEESPFPTLDEAAQLAKEAAEKAHIGGRKFTIAEESQVPLPEIEEIPQIGSLVKPIYEVNSDGSLIDTPEEVYSALQELGHKSFRPGQELGVMRVLSGVSTLVTLSTGSGKSLIYQLPAYMYNKKYPGCITLVISPLVSLMEDQVYCGSKKLRAACLHHNMTQKKREVVLESLKSQTISILLIAPEALSSWDSAKSLFKILPPIAFACIDEAHSISQFSHNFRPSYLTVCQTLREKLGIRTLLGLTATASRSTLVTVISQLGIDDDTSVITDTPLPDNLFLSVSSDENRQEALLTLLHSEHFSDCDSIIIYCTRREECDKLAAFLRVALQESGAPNKKGRISVHAEAYHAGLTAGRRNQVQSYFMTGKLRIVVATVAFGMGINKNDIRCIIHYNMPYCFESYVQEIGRAGRDRLPAYCHLFLDSKMNDLCELRRHIFADSMDRHILRKLLQLVFVPCNCNNDKKRSKDRTNPEEDIVNNEINKESPADEFVAVDEVRCSHHEVAFSIEDTVKTLDLPQEVISTLLAYLQLDKKRWIKVLPLAYTKSKVSSYKGARHLRSVARNCPPLTVVMAEKNLPEGTANLEFDIIQLSRRINWDSGTVKHTLKQLEWTTVDGKPKKTGILVEFSCLGFHVLSPGNLKDFELDEALDLLHSKVIGQEESRLKQLTLFYESLKRVANKNVTECCNEVNLKQCNSLKDEVRNYFTDKDPLAGVHLFQGEMDNETEVSNDIRRLISMHRGDVSLNGRAIARILHGIGSPNFPPIVWGRTKFWRLHLNKDFNSLVKLANKLLVIMR